jgi:NADH pyrophosphatase NudC (nudix superfamily)
MLVLWRNRVLVDGRSRVPHALAGDELEAFAPSTMFGADEADGSTKSDAPAFIELDPARDGMEQLSDGMLRDLPLRFIDPIFELGRVDGDLRRTLVTSLAIARWSDATRFCSQCGAALRWRRPGRVKVCEGPTPHRHWPRLDPSAIMLVSDGERILLGRQPDWPHGMYSTLAGFVDQGETVEECVAREVAEEAGISVGRVTYFGSEPWPFPRSLMLGFFAQATSTEITRGDELEDVRWFTADEAWELQRALAERMPHADTIARRLIAAWLDERGAAAI